MLPSDDELALFVRFEKLDALARQLAEFSLKKREYNPDWKTGYLARRLIRQSRKKGWDLTRHEVRWLTKKVDELLKPPGIETVVDIVEKRLMS